MKIRNWSQSFVLVVILNMLIPFFATFAQTRNVSAEPIDSSTTVLTDTSLGKATATYHAGNNQLEWTVDVSKSGTTKTKFGFALRRGTQYLTPENITGQNKTGQKVAFSLNSQKVLTEDTASDQSIGTIRLKFSTSVADHVELTTVATDSANKNLLTGQSTKTITIMQTAQTDEEPLNNQATTSDQTKEGNASSSSSAVASSEVPDETTANANAPGTADTSSKAEAESDSSASSEKDSKDSDETTEGTSLSDIIPNTLQGVTVGQTAAGDTEVTNYTNIPPVYNDNDSNGEGTHPTNSWSDSDNVINHQGHTGDSTTGSWNNNADDRFIYYGQDATSDSYDFAIKKYATETSTPGEFDVGLNVKGNSSQLVTPLDIMLVVDWSGSMNADQNGGSDRIGAAKEGVNKFVDALSNSGMGDRVELGYLGYSSEGDRYKNGLIPLGDFNDVKNDIKTFTPDRAAGGTFTQKALRDGAAQLLANQNGHKKVLVLLTDGVPTYSYKVTSAHSDTDGFTIGDTFSDTREGRGNTSRLSSPYNVTNANGGDSLEVESTFSATIGEADIIKNSGIQIHGLGIQLGADGNYLNKTRVENLMKKMTSTDNNGALYYESANSAQDIVDYLTSKAITLTGSVVGGEIDNPLGSQYIYDDSDVTVKSVGSVPVTTSGIQIDRSNGKVTVKGINLGKGQEIEVHYKVHLNTEDKNFKPDFWYQMNGETTLAPNDSNPTNKVDFGVPSGKAPATKIKVKKVWDEYNKPEKHPDVNFTVGRKTTTSDSAWKEATGKLSETTGWDKEFDQLTVDGSSVYLPKFNNKGEDFTYTVKSETQVPGYDIPSIDKDKDGQWVITNKQKFSPLSLEVTKVSGDDASMKLDGATFELSGGDLNGAIKLTDNDDGTYSLPAGTKLNKGQKYTLTETAAPAGFEIADANPWQIEIQADGKVVVTDKDGNKVDSKINQDDADNPIIGLNIADPVKEQEFQVEKYRQDSNDKLDGTEFTLTKYSKDWSDPAGESITFTGNGAAQNIKPGYYIVKETTAPTGYQLDDTEYKFYIDDHGKMFDADGNEITKDSLAGKEGFYLTDKGLAFVKYDDLKPFDVQMKKIDKDSNKPIEGVTFITGTKLDGNDVVEEASGTSDANGLLNYKDKDGKTYNFVAGKTYYFQETDATNKYQKLKGYFELVISADGKTATLTYHNPDGTTNTVEVKISMENGNHITFTVTNNAKAPLPSTGGHGIFGYLAIGLLVIAIAMIGLLVNNAYRRKLR
ncbi:SpaA isopeptide-forming pilin-related protein [Lapidilactobacillus bayanensis]|uniref:SpaA isopeptide-forming pilin-related protein n=1 Tax=Lapidilactobacillus bayanensis TaxID=2485998 RepID=UPI000F7A078E|nr:SpaA isopeptide-forming pilin-related protein [Lapidilactobacillus bayanensis]